MRRSEPDFERQVALAFDNLKAVLAAAGCGLENLVDVTTFHTDPEHQFEAVMAVKSRHFPPLPGAALSQLGRRWRDLAGRIRFRDQGRGANSERRLMPATSRSGGEAIRPVRPCQWRVGVNVASVRGDSHGARCPSLS